MYRNDPFLQMRRQVHLVPREEKIRETIEKTKDVYCLQSQENLISYREFLWDQLQYTRKRWWLLQAALLALAWLLLPAMESRSYQMRSMGVIACLFVIFMLPELWRNRESDSLQVEAACLYSLRQVYAARITLFGIVDVALLSVFSLRLNHMGFTLAEVLTQFLLPLTVTACICFGLLCGRGRWSQNMSLTVCLAWCGVWWLIMRNEGVYRRILPTAWMLLFAMAVGLLILTVRKALLTTNQYWEVEFT